MTEERIKQLETIVTRLSRRQVKKTSAIITPYPISVGLVGEMVKGDILRYMFCATGTITKGLISLGAKPKTGITIDISVSNDTGSKRESYVITSKSFLCEPNIEVYSGDKLTVSATPLGEDVISEIWLAFMWTPNVKDATVKNYLIDQLEKE